MTTSDKDVQVALFFRKEIVATGYVLSYESNQKFFFNDIGLDRKLVIISTVLKHDCPMPYPHGEFERLEDVCNYISADVISTRVLWKTIDMVDIKELMVTNHDHIYHNDDIVDCADCDGTIVACAVFKGYCSGGTHLFATVKLLKITTEGNILNSTAEDGNPFFSENQSMIWCLSKLSLSCTKKRKHVSFNEALNESYVYYSNNSSKTLSKRPMQKTGANTKDLNLMTSMGFASYNSDALTGVEDIDHVIAHEHSHFQKGSYNSDVLTDIDYVTVVGKNTTYLSDVLTDVECVPADLGPNASMEARAENRSVCEHFYKVNKRSSFSSPRASIALAANVCSQHNSTFSTFDFDENDDIQNLQCNDQFSQDSILQEMDKGSHDFCTSSQTPLSFKRKRILAFVMSKKAEFVLLSENIRETLMQSCCKELCTRQISYRECEDLRLGVWRKRGADKHNHLLQMFRCFLVRREKSTTVTKNIWDDDHKLYLKPTVAGKNVCLKAFQALLGLSHGMFWQIIGEARNNILYKFHGNMGTYKQRSNSTQGLTVMREILDKHALPQPHLQHVTKDGTVLCEHHLPLGMRKGDVFKSVNARLADTYTRAVSRTTLYRIWKREFRHVKTPVKQRMSKCKTCDDLKRAIETCADTKLRDHYVALRGRHLHHVFYSRKLYAYWKEESKSHPEQSMCLIIDGMDQNTTTLPRFRKTPPRLESSHFLKTHVCGVLVHGYKLFCDVWIDTLHLHDSNQVATSIMRAIRRVHTSRGSLPPILRIQADNCWRENKNRFIFGLCCMLISRNIFEKVEMGFLMVGHTHEDIDQVFSVISRALKSYSVLTMSNMLARIGQKIGGGRIETTEVQLLERMVDWKEFIKPHIVCGNDALEGHTNPHYFRFQMSNGMPIMQWKYYSNDGEDSWSEPFNLLQSIPSKDDAMFLAPTKDVDEDELKGINSFLEYIRYMNAKFPEYKDKNKGCDVATIDLIDYLTKQKSLTASSYAQSLFWPQMLSFHIDGSNECSPQNTNNQNETMDAELLPRRFCGRKGDAPLSEFTPGKEVAVDKFVAIRPPDDAPIWVAKVIGVENDNEGMVTRFKALWYEPKCSRRSGNKQIDYTVLYRNCLSKEWTPSNDGPEYVEIDAVIFAWKSKAKKSTRKHGIVVEKSISIPEIAAAHIQAHLSRVGDESEADIDSEV